MKIPSDDDANPALAGEIQNLRAVMTAEAERAPLPERFAATEHPDRPAYVIRDAETDRTSYVPLYAYAAVRETLADLFGPDAPDGATRAMGFIA